MKDELFSDEALEAALATIQKKPLDDLWGSMEPHDFSEEFEQKMAKLQRQERRHAQLRRLTRWAVAALLAVVMGLGLFFTVSWPVPSRSDRKVLEPPPSWTPNATKMIRCSS